MSAKEIEDTLLAHPDVEEAAAIAVADDERGQVAKVFIVTTRSGDQDFEIELQALRRASGATRVSAPHRVRRIFTENTCR